MSQPRKHHYLPQFYLRGFSIDSRSLYQIEKRTGRFYGGQIKDLAAIRDFHEIDVDGVEDPHAIEKRLAEIEGLLADSLQKYLTEGLRSTDIRSNLIQFVALLRLRVPAVKSYFEKFLESTVRTTAKILERNGQLPKVPEGLEDALSVDNLTFSISNWKCLEMMFNMAADPTILGVLINMRITLYRAPLGDFFVTSDQPVALYHSGIDLPNGTGVGPGTPGVELTVPLSSTVMLKLDHEHGSDRELTATSEEVREFNRRTIVMAEDYVFSGEEPLLIADFVSSLRSVFGGFRQESIEADGGFYLLGRCLPVLPAPADA